MYIFRSPLIVRVHNRIIYIFKSTFIIFLPLMDWGGGQRLGDISFLIHNNQLNFNDRQPITRLTVFLYTYILHLILKLTFYHIIICVDHTQTFILYYKSKDTKFSTYFSIICDSCIIIFLSFCVFKNSKLSNSFNKYISTTKISNVFFHIDLSKICV